MWKPISFEKLLDEIHEYETELDETLWNFWCLIKINPEKWMESSYGNEGNGFWVVAICGRHIIWYNDIEEGFNISKYNQYGEIAEYYCEQDQIDIAVFKLWKNAFS